MPVSSGGPCRPGGTAVAGAVGLLMLLSMAAVRPAAGQSFHQDLQRLLDGRPEPALYQVKPEPKPAPLTIRRVSEAETMFLGALRVYQATLSSQDLNSCSFTPSCSRFGVAAVQQAGLVRGTLLTGDRLARCHGLPSMLRQYRLDLTTGRFLDPLEPYVTMDTEEDGSHAHSP